MDYVQLMLFEEPLDLKVKNELKKLKDSNDRSRKAQFAQIGEMRKWFADLEERLAIIEQGICRNDLQVVKKCEIIDAKIEVFHDANFSPICIPTASRMHLFCQPCAY
jgi:hypothetical protein